MSVFEFFRSVFSRIRTEEILRISPYSVRMRENTDQKTPNMDIFYAVKMSLILEINQFYATDIFQYPLKISEKPEIFPGGIERDQWHEIA